MKSCLIIILSLTLGDLYAQVRTDKKIARQFHNAFLKLDSFSKDAVKEIELEKAYSGVGIFLSHNIDTLNLADFIDPGLKFSVSNHVGKEIGNNSEKSHYFLALILSQFLGDTLRLNIGGLLPSLELTLINSGIKASYTEYQRHDSIFKLRLSDIALSKLEIPVKVSELKLSSSNFNSKPVIYGKMAYETAPYYVDDRSFKNGFLQKRIRATIVFRIKNGA